MRVREGESERKGCVCVRVSSGLKVEILSVAALAATLI